MDQSFRAEIAQIKKINSKLIEVLENTNRPNVDIAEQLLKKESEVFDRKKESKDLGGFKLLLEEVETTGGYINYTNMISKSNTQGAKTDSKVKTYNNGKSVLPQDNIAA